MWFPLRISSVGLLLLVFLSSSFNLQSGHAEKILVVSFISTKSHKLTYMPLVHELGRRGHEITVVSPIKGPKTPAKNVKEILTFDAEAVEEEFLKKTGLDLFKIKEEGKRIDFFSMFSLFKGFCSDIYDLPQVKELLKEAWDLVILQPMFNECALGLVYRIKAPLILFSPVSAAGLLTEHFGNYYPPSFVPNIMIGLQPEMNFYERMLNFGFDVMFKLTMKWVYMPAVTSLYREKMGEDVPSVDEILGNASLILSNGHFSLHGHKPFLPDIVEVGGLHSRPAKPLAKDLEDFIAKGKENGFIYFSLGSALKGNKMSEEKRKLFLNVFAKVKQQVLWKWETETMEGLPENVKLAKWLPQQDLLGHKDIKMFITHCGGGSMEEAIYHGVPLVGLPILGDQPLNARIAKQHGFIQELEWNTVTEEDLLNAINEIVDNPKYEANVKQLSNVFRDQPEDPMTRAVFWVEYVIRHKGAVHLRSAGRKLNYFQYHSYDVIINYLLLIVVVLLMIWKMGKFLLCKFKSCVTGRISSSKKRN